MAGEARVRELEAETTARDQRIAELEAEATARTQEDERLGEQLKAIRNSTIWRATAPLRYLLNKLRSAV